MTIDTAELTGCQDMSSFQQTRLQPQLDGSNDDRLGDLVKHKQRLGSSFPSRVDAQPSKRQGRAEKEAIRKRKYHQRMKQERDSLRGLVGELSEHLEELQHLKRLKGSSAAKNQAIVNSAWRDCAARQRDERRRAEAEQVQLLAAAKAQASYIHNLCDNLPGDSEATVFRAQLRRVKECFAQVDDVFREFEVDGLPDGVTSSVRRRQDGEVDYFQHFNQFTQPYSYDQTHHTMWKLAKLQHRQEDRKDFEGLDKANDTVALCCRQLHALPTGAKVSVLQRYVNRRFVERDRTVFVWRSHSQGEGLFHGMRWDETGWVCLQPSAEEGATAVRICVRQAPLRFNLGSPGSPSGLLVGEFHQVMQNAVREDMIEISSALDKMLLDDTLDGIHLE